MVQGSSSSPKERLAWKVGDLSQFYLQAWIRGLSIPLVDQFAVRGRSSTVSESKTAGPKLPLMIFEKSQEVSA